MNSLTFDSLIGQDKAKKMLLSAVAGNKMSHAYLFRGPAGVGKKSLALRFAAYLNCLAPKDDEPCGTCPSCHKFISGNHPDLMIIEPDGAAIKINQIRQLKQALTFPPFEAGHRVVILTEIQTMRREAANSLLKTLEEPPPDNLLILCADEAGPLLPTILSRCQAIPFYPLPYEAVAAHLSAEGMEPAEAASLAALAEGSIGQAKLYAAKNLLPLRRRIIEGLINTSNNDPASSEIVLQLAEETAALKENVDDLLDLLKTWFRDIVIHLHHMPEKIMNRDLAAFLDQAGRRWQMSEIADIISRLDLARRQLARNCNRTLVLEVLFFALL